MILHLQNGVVDRNRVAKDDGFRDGGRVGKGVGEHLGEAHAGAVVQLLGVIDGDAQHARDAPVRVTLDGVEVEHRALKLRQLLDSLQDFFLGKIGCRNVVRNVSALFLTHVFGDGLQRQRGEIGLLAQVVDAMVHGDAPQPMVEVEDGAGRGEALHRLQKDILRQVLRHGEVVHIALAQPDNPAETAPVLPLYKFHLVHTILLPISYCLLPNIL